MFTLRPMLPPSSLAAAHSMDTDWFAVDDDGRVAQFSSGEYGAVPFDTLDLPDVEDVIEYVDTEGSRPQVIELAGRYSSSFERYSASARGLYHYRHSRIEVEISTPYQRWARPLDPARVEDLPALIRDRCLRLEGARFECDALLQPLDYFAGRANSEIPFVSARRWGLFAYDAQRRLMETSAAEELLHPEKIPGELLRWDLADALVCLANAGDQGSLIERRWLDELALREPPSHEQSRARNLRVRSPARKTVPKLRSDAHEALEDACAQGRLPLSWLSDAGESRRFLAHAAEWIDNAMFEDLRDANGMMSLPFLPARILAELSSDHRATITAEQLARDERQTRTVYYRDATATDLRALRALRSSTATERERAIFDLGYALDPLVPWAAVLWVETGLALPMVE